MSSLRLRPPRPDDERAVRAAQLELAAAAFEFAFGLTGNTPWTHVLAECDRRRGYATEILRQSLIVARAFGVDAALLTCDDGNVASATVIERCGGVRDPDRPGEPPFRRYWIA